VCRLTAFPLAFVVAFALVSPVAAYVLWGWYNTGAIDTDRNRQADLTVCFGVNLGDLVYVNRGDVEQEIEQWHQASQGNFSSLGICNNDGSNVQMLYADFGTCEPGHRSWARLTTRATSGTTLGPSGSTVSAWTTSTGMTRMVVMIA
jgi:hypothetical protein